MTLTEEHYHPAGTTTENTTCIAILPAGQKNSSTKVLLTADKYTVTSSPVSFLVGRRSSRVIDYGSGIDEMVNFYPILIALIV